MNKKTKKYTFQSCKKAQDVNILFVIVMALVIAIVIVAGYMAVKQLNSAIQSQSSFSQESKDMMQTVQNRYVGIWDLLFLFYFVIIFIIMIFSAFFIDTHPVFFILSIIMIVVSAFIGGHIANAYAQFESTPDINAYASQFTIIPFIFQHYVQLIIIMGFITAIALYAKLRSSG